MPARVALLGNHWTALVAAERLLAAGALVGAATPRVAHDANRRLAALAARADVTHAMLARHTLTEDLGRWLGRCKPDAVFVVGCPYRMPAALLEQPRNGFWNFHFGLLPRYRGPDPVFWQIRNREPLGGVTVHRMDEELDHGPVVATRAVAIASDDTFGVHVNKLAIVLGDLVLGLVRDVAEGPVGPARAQDGNAARYQPRPTVRDLTIDWRRDDAPAIAALVCAANPVYGGALTVLRGAPVRVLEATAGTEAPSTMQRADTPPGTIVAGGGQMGLWVTCAGSTSLRLDVVATDDGIMSAAHFRAVYALATGERCATPTA